MSHAGDVTGARRLQPWSDGPSLGDDDDGGGGDDDTSHYGGPHAAGVAAAVPNNRGDDFVNTPPGCTEKLLQQKRECAPPCPQETMYVSYERRHIPIKDDATTGR
jgi:hypothetical protein